ncbi:PAS domain S-box protein [Salidesulfovibrio onnuriiensis]|uniref:PAS domain S-box protein n=1 Tax=Salidesulfovibrio onnuriiensis TaxID=2583823 RepID=UPI0011CA097B|nr:PAS domain S-box protein [Salidesulfovibrio onnuriiensis]
MDQLRILLIHKGDIARHGIHQALPPNAMIQEVNDGQEAVFAFSRYSPDLIITEFDLPRMSGIEVSRAVHSIDPEVEIVMLADAFDAAIYAQAVEAGVTNCVIPELLENELAPLLDRILQTVALKKEMKTGQIVLGHILKGLPHPALLLDARTMRILSANTAAAALGFAPGQICSGDICPTNWRKVITRSIVSGDDVCRNETVTGDIVWKTTTAMTSGTTVFFMAEDITEAKQAHEKIQESENLLAAIVDNSYDAILLFDAERNIIQVNKRMLDMFGCTEEEAKAQRIDSLICSGSREGAAFREDIRSALDGSPCFFECCARRMDDNSKLDVEVFLRGLAVRSSTLLLANIRDVTQRKKAEVDYVSIQRQLEEQILERKATLLEVTERLSLELSKCDILQDKLGVARESSKQLIATSRSTPLQPGHFIHPAALGLSKRELQVVIQLASGTSPTAIAQNMGLSPKTVSTYKRRAMSKIGIESEADLVRYATHAGLVF